MANLLAYGTQIVGGGSGSSPSTGGGHVIVNASGTELAQEDKLQFAGSLKTTDDSTNGQTVVDDSPTEIEWSVWNTMTDAEKEAIPKALVVNAPGIDGPIDVDLITKLWENQNPTSAFAAQTVTLASDDYDFLIHVFKNSNSGSLMFTSVIQKGSTTTLLYTIPYSDAVFSARRQVDYTSATSLAFNDAYGSNNGSTPQSLNNNVCIPYQIYGIKKTITVDVSGIISDVSTDADKCMLSNGKSVEDTINKGSVSVNADGTKTYAQLWNELFALIDKTKITRNSQLVWYTGYYSIIFNVRSYQATEIILYYAITLSTGLLIDTVTLSSASAWTRGSASSSGTTVTSKGSEVPSSSYVFTFYY